MEAVDRHLGGGMRASTVHDVHAATSLHSTAANAFALGLALRASARTLVWVVEDRARHEAGALYGPGLHEWGLEPERLLLVKVARADQLLAAGEEALRSGAAGAVIMSGWGEARAITLTSSRRLSMAAQRGGGTGFLVRAAAQPGPSAADTRWSVRSAPSVALEARAPGRPAFAAQLTRSRSGAPPAEWIMEWDRETRSFVEPALSVGLVSLPAQRSAGQGELRRAG